MEQFAFEKQKLEFLKCVAMTTKNFVRELKKLHKQEVPFLV
jgi:hypothetical protein